MEKQLAVVVADAVYGRTLADYMSSSHVLSYRIRAFYDAADYLQFRDENKVEVLLVDEASEKLLPGEDEKYRLLLTEKRTDNPGSVFMYQALDVIVKEIYYKIHDNRPISGESHSISIYSVLGARGGCGVTTLSLCLAKALGRMRRVLLVSFDRLMVLPEDLPTLAGAVGEMIYAVKLHKAMWVNHAEDFVKHGRDFDYVCGLHCYEELSSFAKEDARDFFAGLSADGRYDCLVFDLGSLPMGASVALEKSERIFMIAAEDSPGAEMMKNQILAACGKEVCEKTELLSMPYDKLFSKGKVFYHDYDNTEMFEFAKKLTEGKERLSDRSEVTDNSVNELAVREQELPYVPVRKRLFGLLEKGFSEGFRG